MNTPANAGKAQGQQLSQPQIWPRRQEAQQQVPIELTSIEGVERMNVVTIHLEQQQTEFMLRCNQYAIEID